MNDEIDKQMLVEMTKFPPSPDIRNIMVTGGNGFMYVLARLNSHAPYFYCHSSALFRHEAWHS